MKRGIRARTQASAGYTVLELLVAITVLAVVLGITVPAMGEFVARSRASSQVNELVGALHLARSEAVTRGVPVAVCPSNALSTACANSANWSGGWIVFADVSGVAGTVDGTDTILRTFASVKGAILSAEPDSARFVRYAPSGFLSSDPLSIHYNPLPCSGTDARQVSITPLGRPDVSYVSC
jgi:type IV fimbrial biogenesis protein FimT